jgi:hypothetical protein
MIIALQDSPMSSYLRLPVPPLPFSCDSKSETSTDDDPDLHDALPTTSSKAKSSLCKNFTEKGSCPYGRRCQFAHGPTELRINMHHNHSYKTKPCHAYLQRGYCCYGARCNFIHAAPPQNPRERWTAIYQAHRETLRGERSVSRLVELLGL